VPYFQQLASTGVIPITDARMTRFWITLDQGVDFVVRMIGAMSGGELFVPRIPSMRLLDLATAIAPEARVEIVGIRPGEKLHEEMIGVDDARRTRDAGDFYVMQPDAEWWNASAWKDADMVPDGFRYTSDANTQWLSVDDLRRMLDA
jgi:UDP-N-acetylglucosamine 4,6-dehydratase